MAFVSGKGWGLAWNMAHFSNFYLIPIFERIRKSDEVLLRLGMPMRLFTTF